MNVYAYLAIIAALAYGVWWVDDNGYDRAMAKQAQAIIALETKLGKMKDESQAKIAETERTAGKLKRQNDELIKQAMAKDPTFRGWHDALVPAIAADIFWMFGDAGGALSGRPRITQADPVARPPG